jgi:hypothetical protein
MEEPLSLAEVDRKLTDLCLEFWRFKRETQQQLRELGLMVEASDDGKAGEEPRGVS